MSQKMSPCVVGSVIFCTHTNFLSIRIHKWFWVDLIKLTKQFVVLHEHYQMSKMSNNMLIRNTEPITFLSHASHRYLEEK